MIGFSVFLNGEPTVKNITHVRRASKYKKSLMKNESWNLYVAFFISKDK